jgi:hypothetical protein
MPSSGLSTLGADIFCFVCCERGQFLEDKDEDLLDEENLRVVRNFEER